MRVGTVGATRVAHWDGTAWSPLGTGLSAAVLGPGAGPSGEVRRPSEARQN